MTIEFITKQKFEEETKKDAVLILKFSASWCAPCKQLAPIFEEVSKEIKGNFYEVDIDKEPELAQKFSIMSVPTIIALKQNKELLRVTGVMPKDTLKNKITSYL